MTPEKIEQLNKFTREQYTQYVIGWLAATLDTSFKNNGVYIDRETLISMQAVIGTASAQLLSNHNKFGVTVIPYNISGVLNEDDSILTIVYEMTNDFIESPFQYTLTALNKNQIH